ncbi:lysozyme family protein [Candidatus Enterococcus clewellii]|uniref:Peptidase C51 domain-containing protein n=1 Tax=Candidatus Enterococcus clewellii TaxID=1834193 RepID=A0A242K8M9_9ENTE|nr:lysozyme family protein [Enterococcus sp. 9E7_DIV0242]OTP17429.1 hypothetical protein A5888_001567 [Enterococcus sp. 9E7_DIV0242]
MIRKFSLFGAALVFLSMFMFMTGGGGKTETNDNTTENVVTVGLPEEVLQYEEIVKNEAKKHNISDKVPVLLAIMAVESGGRGNDVMQSSESLGLPVNSLQPIASIQQGVKYYASLLRSARAADCDDDVAIACYNFGGGYLDFVIKNGKKHTIEIAEKFSRDVVAPSLGNTTGEKYHYPNPVADNYGNYLYWNGGNFFYVNLVKQFLSSGSDPNVTIAILDSVLGQRVNNGECYGLTAYYVQKLGGPTMMGSGFMSASAIGTDYDWASYGWTVILRPKIDQINAGDVINWSQDPIYAPTIYGHTGVVKSVNKETGKITTYEQNAEKGRIAAIYERPWVPSFSSVVRKK